MGIIRSILVTDDKASDWEPVRASERYRMKLYRRFFEESGEGFGRQGEQVPQTWIVGDVDHCVDDIKPVRSFGITDIVSMAVPPTCVLVIGQFDGSLPRWCPRKQSQLEV